MNENELKDIAVAIAQALGLKKAEEVLQVISNMSKEGILSVYLILNSNLKLDLKIIAIQEVVKADLLKSEVKKAQLGAKLEYIKYLKKGSTIKTFRQDGDPGSVDSTRGMILNKKLKKMISKKQSGGLVDKFNFLTYKPTKQQTLWHDYLNRYNPYQSNSNEFKLSDYLIK